MPTASASISGSARRYADAAFAVARESGELDQWQAALDNLASMLATPDARVALTSPAVSQEEKLAVVEQLSPPLSPMLRNFLRLVVERGRVGELPGIANAFRGRVLRERGVAIAEVTTAIPLDPQLERTLAQRLAAHLGRAPDSLLIESRVDPSIIGGVVARVGDTLIDDSVRGRLERLRRVIAG